MLHNTTVSPPQVVCGKVHCFGQLSWAERCRDRAYIGQTLRRFHEVEPQRSLAELVPPSVLSRRLSAPPKRGVPFPSLTENTLVLSDSAALAPIDGQLCLAVRCARSGPGLRKQAAASLPALFSALAACLHANCIRPACTQAGLANGAQLIPKP